MKTIISARSIILTLIGLILTVACTFQKPATEIPQDAATREAGLPTEGLAKTFFVDASGKPKTFMCGLAPVTEMSWFSQETLMHNAPLADHCNMEFEISEKYLIGKIVNPSFPSDRTRWKIGLTIPIRKHYYYEKAKDNNGRETNEFIENEGRSHWSARPYIKLDLTSLNLMDAHMESSNLTVYQGSSIKAEDIEWDTKLGFLGFTYTQALGGTSWYNDQARIRFNLIEFKHNANFRKTPFNDKNYNYMNVLHITGEKVQGVWPILYAAKWDSSRQHEIYLVDFPKEYIEIAKKVVDEWNEAFVAIEAIKKPGSAEEWDKIKPFKIKEDKTLKYGFDLRYSTITWISDQKISRAGASALGVAMAHADVRNGEILWGGITLWGGVIEEYIKGNMSSTAGTDGEGSKNYAPMKKISESLMGQMTRLKMDKKMSYPLNVSELKNGGLPSGMASNEKFAGDFSKLSSLINEGQQKVSSPGFYTDMIGKSLRFNIEDTLQNMAANERAAKGMSEKDIMEAKMHSMILCSDRTFADVGAGWRDGMNQSQVRYEDALESVVKELISHEYGHFLGLGHQFKESILPEEGTIPPAIYKNLKEKAVKNFTNMTSVMGYRNPKVEVITPASEIVPGEQDKLVLRFLYRLQYTTYKAGDENFTYVEMDENGNGIIPTENPAKTEYKTTYFPQCNDIEASIGGDPLCNRFDAGYDAKTVVDNYFKDLKGNLAQSLIAFTENRGVNPESAENWLWYKSLNAFGRIRVFYDFMRFKYRAAFEELRNDEKLLYSFSNACEDQSQSVESAKLAEIFTKYKGLKDLCQVNLRILREIQQMATIKASDYTRIDTETAYTPGGISTGDAERNWGHFLGTWNELSAIPLKVSALYALTTNTPWIMWGGLWPLPRYDLPQFRYAYSSLFPKEFTKIISKATSENLFFSKASIGTADYTTMGATVYMMSWFNYLSQSNNDKMKLPSTFVNNLNNQSEFELSPVAIIIKTEGDGIIKRKVSGQVYDFRAGKLEPLSEVFLLPSGRLIARGSKMFIYPLPNFNLTFFSETEAYTFAYRVKYSEDRQDKYLTGFSIKTELQAKNDKLLDACIRGTNGEQNGLSSFFTRGSGDGIRDDGNSFTGFRVDKGITVDSDAQTKFMESIDKNFKVYEKVMKKDLTTCNEALKGLAVVVSTAAILNFNWVPEAETFSER